MSSERQHLAKILGEALTCLDSLGTAQTAVEESLSNWIATVLLEYAKLQLAEHPPKNI